MLWKVAVSAGMWVSIGNDIGGGLVMVVMALNGVKKVFYGLF